MDINQSIRSYDNSIQKSKQIYSGILGLAIDGTKKVNIETRAGYVYVRLRDNLSEVIQAYNDKVSPVYDFPVLLERKGNKWYITGRDDARYETFGTASPFLPQHGDSHSFNRDSGGGGDTVWVYPDQFIPLLVYPSGSFGASNLMIAPYVLQRDSDFIYVGNTGTGNLLIYKPTDSQAIIGLVGINRVTGNPSILIASGTPLAGTTTGTSAIAPYMPYPSSDVEPLYAFRLVSGTTALTWDNLYNARQFFGGSSSTSTGTSGGISGIVAWDEGVVQGTGSVVNFVGSNVDVSVSGSVIRVFVTGSSGGALPTFITGSIPFAASDGTLTEINPLLWWDETHRGFRIGRSTRFDFADTFPIGITAKNPDETISIGMLAYGTGSSGAPSVLWNGYRTRGTPSSPLPVRTDDIFTSFVGRGFDGANYSAQARINLVANGEMVTGAYTSTRIDMLVISSGSNATHTQLSVYGDSVNQPTGSTYNVGGLPHTHVGADINAAAPLIFGSHGQGVNVPGSSTRYMIPFINGIQSTAYSIPLRGGTLKNLFVRQAGAMPADGNMVVEIYSGAVGALAATGIKVTFTASSAAQDRTDTTHTFSHADGEHVYVALTKTGGLASSNVGGVVFELHTSLTAP